ncbi:MAG: MarR family transcriptional regulator [Oscillospiraceae bacterium]|nr:MarR family transcriptional regulator [Oscillospiraceae bacterium]
MITRFERFTAAIAGIHRDVQKIERDEMEKFGLKGAYAQYLVVMARYPEGITAARLCDLSDKDKAAVSRAVAEMEKKGILIREDVNESGYRALLKLTPQGKKAAEYVFGKAKTAVAVAGDGLTAEQRIVMYDTLEHIAANLKEITRRGIQELKEEKEA